MTISTSRLDQFIKLADRLVSAVEKMAGGKKSVGFRIADGKFIIVVGGTEETPFPLDEVLQFIAGVVKNEHDEQCASAFGEEAPIICSQRTDGGLECNAPATMSMLWPGDKERKNLCLYHVMRARGIAVTLGFELDAKEL